MALLAEQGGRWCAPPPPSPLVEERGSEHPLVEQRGKWCVHVKEKLEIEMDFTPFKEGCCGIELK